MTHRTAKRCIWAFFVLALALNWAIGDEPKTVNWQAGDGAKHYGG